MRYGDRVKIVDKGIFQDPELIGKKGTIRDYHYSIRRWWDKGEPLDHSVDVELDDGTTERFLESDLRGA